MELQTAEEFRAAIQRYLKAHEMTVGGLAKKIQRPRTTVEWWYYHGITKGKDRRKIQEQYPWLFDSTKETPLEIPLSSLENIQLRLASFVKTEQAREAILYLTATLEWFLFKAMAEERNRFRDALGKDWEHFLGLTRAMTNEKALEIAQQEGELKWNR
ncbi:MAG: hypothetical protein AAB584_00150 [Patescibacteria group bacterium]